MSSGAQALASGATEQAASVEELSVTVTNVAEQAVANSENVRIASQFVEETGKGVETGNDYMVQLTEAMMEIDTASNQIANITKVIEDIAFQTNILALMRLSKQPVQVVQEKALRLWLTKYVILLLNQQKQQSRQPT